MTLELVERAVRSLSTSPVIAGFHPDPSLCVDEDGVYWLVTSSFEYAPGVPVLRSEDLLEWSHVGNVLTSDTQFVAGGAPASGGVYAPTLRHHAGRFWLITSDVRPGSTGQILLHTTNPSAGWSDPIRIEALEGIDPDLAWDDDGVCHVTYCSTAEGLRGIAQAPVDAATGRVLRPPHALWNGTGLAFPEAPHLYRHDGWWYLLIAEGGTERGHSVSAARSRSITGPFAGAPGNPVFSHRSTDHPVQNTGHADLLRRPDGSWCAAYLGVRPRGRTPGFHVLGRETFLAGVEWVDGWPSFDVERFSAPDALHDFTDVFVTDVLHPRWASPGLRPEAFVTRSPLGGAELRAVRSPNGSDGLLGTRVTDLRWSFEADVDTAAGSIAVVLRLDDDHRCAVRLEHGIAAALLKVGPLAGVLGRSSTIPGPIATLRIRAVEPTHGGPDDLELSVDGSTLARFDGRYLSTEVAGGFTGRVVGVAATRARARVLAVRYRSESAGTTAGRR